MTMYGEICSSVGQKITLQEAPLCNLSGGNVVRWSQNFCEKVKFSKQPYYTLLIIAFSFPSVIFLFARTKREKIEKYIIFYSFVPYWSPLVHLNLHSLLRINP